MLGTILAAGIPVGYLAAGSAAAAHVKRTIRIRLNSKYGGKFENDEATIAAVLIGLCWPFAFPFYLAVHGAGGDRDE